MPEDAEQTAARTGEVGLAAVYYATRGWAPVPIPARSKGPRLKGWGQLRITAETASEYFNGGGNIGIILGAPSGGLVDVDLDVSEARRVADRVLPATPLEFGRASSPRSHRLYMAPRAAYEAFRDPTDQTMLVELRASSETESFQTVFPPSIHESGEAITGDVYTEAAQVGAHTLRRNVAHLAAASLLARHDGPAGRDEFLLALQGGLLRSGWPVDRVEAFCLSVVLAGEPDPRDQASAGAKLAGDVKRTAAKLLAGDAKVTGWTRLGELTDPRIGAAVRDWLDCGSAASEPGRTRARLMMRCRR